MRRPVVAGAAAIAGLGVASVGLVLWATSLGRPAPAPDGAAAPQAAPGRLAPAPAPPALPTEALALRNPRSALAPPEERAWEQLRPLARPIAPLVRALEGPVAPCFEEETQARFGPLPHTSLS